MSCLPCLPVVLGQPQRVSDALAKSAQEEDQSSSNGPSFSSAPLLQAFAGQNDPVLTTWFPEQSEQNCSSVAFSFLPTQQGGQAGKEKAAEEEPHNILPLTYNFGADFSHSFYLVLLENEGAILN